MTTLAPSDLVRDALREELEAELASYFARRSTEVARWGEQFRRLWELAGSHATGGKLLRPALLLQMHDALRAPDASNRVARTTLLDLAVGIELLHFAFLLHDDVIDDDEIRRGRSNVIGTLRRADASQAHTPADGVHWARSNGILMGDLMLSAAHRSYARADLHRDTRLRLLDLFDRVVEETVAGEHLDIGLSDGILDPSMHTVLTMTARKTAAYSFELPLRTAAVLAEATAPTEELLARIARHLGTAFQLQDDLLSTFGDADAHGKDALSDIRGGKQTAIIAFARTTPLWSRISEVTSSAPDAGEAATIRDLLRDCGAERFVRGLIEEHLSATTRLLEEGARSGAIPPSAHGVLTDLRGRLDGRRS